MWKVISLWFGKGLEKVVLGAGAVAAFFAILWRAKNQGKLEERERQEAKRLKVMHEEVQQQFKEQQKLQEKRDEIDSLSDDDISRRLRERWTRD